MRYVKKIYDSVHGFIYFSDREKDLIDSSVFQRLHYLRQLGVAYLVYPGATHSRFQHSLGVMHIATQIFDQILATYEHPIDEDLAAYFRQVVRLAALCHDLGHLPFSHTAEDVVLGNDGHEKWTLALIQSSFLEPIWKKITKDFPGTHVQDDVAKIALGEKKWKLLQNFGKATTFSSWDHLLSQVVAGDFFGADRIDYLVRDARCTGVSHGLFDYQQLIAMLHVLPYGEEGRLTLGIEENGIESCESLLLSRHFMHKRVYQYPSVKAYSFHMARFLSYFCKEHKILSSVESYLSYTDNEVLTDLRKALFQPEHPRHDDALALLSKKHRYASFPIVGEIDLQDLEKIKKDFSVSSEDFVVFALEQHKKEGLSRSFPVLSRRGSIEDAENYFSISVPSSAIHWIYVSEKYPEVMKALWDKYPSERRRQVHAKT